MIRLGDVIEWAAKPTAKALHLSCLDENNNLQPQSRCGRWRDWLNQFSYAVSDAAYDVFWKRAEMRLDEGMQKREQSAMALLEFTITESKTTIRSYGIKAETPELAEAGFDDGKAEETARSSNRQLNVQLRLIVPAPNVPQPGLRPGPGSSGPNLPQAGQRPVPTPPRPV
jgi:hypothetical protein